MLVRMVAGRRLRPSDHGLVSTILTGSRVCGRRRSCALILARILRIGMGAIRG